MVLVQKWPFFQLFILSNIGQDNVFYDILDQTNVFLGYKNKKFEKVKKSNIDIFFKGVNSWFWSNNGHFSKFLFLGNIAQEKFSYDILKRKNVFLGYQNKKFKKSKNWNFFKRFTHGF